MSVSGFTTLHDSEFFQFQTLRRAVLASEARRKAEQQQRRIAMGLPEVENSGRGIVSRVLGLGKSEREGSSDREERKGKRECEGFARVEKMGGEERKKGGVGVWKREVCGSEASSVSEGDGSRKSSMQVVDMRDVLGEKWMGRRVCPCS